MSELKIKNYMEDIVADMLEQLKPVLNICGCERCQMDLSAFVLNKLPPKYVVTSAGGLYTKMATMHHQFDVDVMAAITQAAIVIGEHPRHGE